MNQRDVFGHIMEKQVNDTPLKGGVIRKAKYLPHLGQMQVTTEQYSRKALLQENAELYKANKGGFRRDLAGGVPMRIPKLDYDELYKNNPWLNHCDKETKAKFFMKLYETHPEYRIG